MHDAQTGNKHGTIFLFISTIYQTNCQNATVLDGFTRNRLRWEWKNIQGISTKATASKFLDIKQKDDKTGLIALTM